MGNKKLQIFGFWRLASWCKSFILSQLSLGLIVKDKLLNYVDITHTSISFTENAFPQQLIIISYFHLLSCKLDWCHEIILLKKQWEVDEMSEAMRGTPAPPSPLCCLCGFCLGTLIFSSLWWPFPAPMHIPLSQFSSFPLHPSLPCAYLCKR